MLLLLVFNRKYYYVYSIIYIFRFCYKMASFWQKIIDRC